jgi:ABC-2 type transport system permease protein
MSLRRTLAITRRLLAQFRHDRRTLGLLFAAPIVILGLFALLLRSDAEVPSLGVVELDDGPLGVTVVEALRDAGDVEVVELDEAAAEAQVTSGEIDGYVVLAEDFSSEAMAGRIAPDIRLEGTQPSTTATILQAVQGALLTALRDLAVQTGQRMPELDPQVAYRHGGEELDQLDILGGSFVALTVFFLVYVVTAVSFLRERTLGTLERLLASPLRRPEIVVGYMLAFTLVALVQAAEVLVFALWVLNIYNAGDVALIFGVEALLAVSAVSLGIFLSAFARTEFQAVQFIPLVVAPQILLSGLIVPVEAEPGWLQVISNVLPLTYAVDALQEVMLKGSGLAAAGVQRDVGVIAAFCLVAIVAASATLRRRIA